MPRLIVGSHRTQARGLQSLHKDCTTWRASRVDCLPISRAYRYRCTGRWCGCRCLPERECWLDRAVRLWADGGEGDRGETRPGQQAWRWAVVGSNAAALKQHAYSVFTASRRDRTSSSSLPESVRRAVSSETPSTRTGKISASAGSARPVQFTEPKTPVSILHDCEGIGLISRSASYSDDAVLDRDLFQGSHVAVPGRAPTHDEIRMRAYERYLARDGQPGDPVADWLAAEAELKRERGLA